MKQSLFLLALLAACFTISTCAITPDYSNVPELKFMGISKNTMKQGALFSDSLEVYVDFTDGDGDIGAETTNLNPNLFIIDSRTNNVYDAYKLPQIPEQGSNNGVEGTMVIKIYSVCCVYPKEENIIPCDTTSRYPINEMNLKIYMVDRAGNKSNEVQTSDITLNCL